MKISSSKVLRRLVDTFVALMLCVCLASGGMATVFAQVQYIHHYYGGDWTWGTSASDVDEAVENAAKIAEQIAAEGQVLLKNENSALPLQGSEWVTVFSTSGTKEAADYAEGIAAGGFKVHSTTATNVDKYTPDDIRAHGSSDVAVILISGECEATQDAYGSGPCGAGEGTSSASLTELEDNKDADGNTYKLPSGIDFEHKASPMMIANGESEAKAYKHNLQLLNSDEKIIKYAKDNFKKVIVILQNDVPSEIGSLQYDEDIDAILLSGRIGAYGKDQIGKVLNGTVNPSGKTVDLWAWDITGRPSWYNDGNANNIYKSATSEDSSSISNMGITSVFRVDENSEYYDAAVAKSGNDSEEYPYYVRQVHATGDIVPHVYTVQYEEDIYTGYRYYETAATEVDKGNYVSEGYTDGETYYKDSVIYPFGYGLSYTSFVWEVVATDMTAWNAVVNSANSDITNKTGKITIKVKVTNVGSVAGMDVVEIYGHSPYYLNGISKAENELVGFEKTGTIQPGKSEIVTLTVNVQDLASYDYLDANGNGNTGYELDKVGATDTAGNELHDSTGHYELRVMKNSHDYGNCSTAGGMVVTLTDPTKDFNLKVDDFTGNTVGNLFSGDDINNTLGYDPATQKTLVEEGKMTLLTRADFAGTWPVTAGTTEGPNGEAKGWDLVRSDEYYAMITEFADYNGENWQDYYKIVNGVSEIPTTVTSEDKAGFDWSITGAMFADLTKAEYTPDGGTTQTLTWSQRDPDANLATLQASEDWINFNEMINYEYNDGGIGTYMWTKFMNQLTYNEMVEWVTNGGRRTSAIDSVNKAAAQYVDSTENLNSSNSFGWGYNSVSSRTWNKELTYKRGVVVAEIGLIDGIEAYYAPAVDLHRSPFAGRNDEYWSEDGFLAGYLAGNMLAGVQSTGMICTIKHFALNENENMRQSLHTYVSEQALRELYVTAFQICIQECGAQGVMTAYNCIGDMHASSAYNFLVGMTENEWGFDGFNITDAADPWKDFYTHDMALRAGTTMFLCDWSASKTYVPGANSCTVQLYPTGEYNVEDNKVYVREDGKVADSPKTVESYTSWYWLRYNVMRSLFVEANSNIARNGIDLAAFKPATLDATTQGAEFKANIALEGVSAAEYTVDEDTLPEGLKLSSSGEISGTPLVSGNFEFTVTLVSGNFITTSAKFALSIASAFEMDTETVGNAKEGEAFSGYISSDSIKTQADDPSSKYTKLTYSVSSGTLPEGLTLNASDGLVSGTPTKAGVYNVTFTVKAESTSSGGQGGTGGKTATTFGNKGGGSSSSSKEFKFNYVFTVDAGEPAPVVKYLTEAEVTAMINAVQVGLSEAQVTALINTALGQVDSGLTETQVKALIETALAESNANKGCGSVVGISALSIVLMMGAAVVVLAKRKHD